jgi:hypothetical protein
MLHFSNTFAVGSLAILVLLASGCNAAPHTPPLFIADYEVVATDIPAIERLLDRIAERHGLRPYRKDRSQMARISFGKEAFFTALYLEDHPLLIATNAGTGIVLKVNALSHPGVSSAKVLGICSEFTTALEQELALKRRASAT